MGWFSRLMDSVFSKPAWPAGAEEFQPGVWYVPYDGARGGPFKTPEEARAWMRAVDLRNANSRENDAATAAKVYEGRFPARNFMLGANEGREAAFIYAASRLYSGDLYRNGLFSGSFADINRLINYGEQEQIFEHKTYEQTVADFPSTPLKVAVMAYLAPSR